MVLSLGEVLCRVDEARAGWIDLPAHPGLYLVLWPMGTPLEIRDEAGEVADALRHRWAEITRQAATDILYIGKANSLRSRIRQLARFGRGRAVNHQGGRDLWWIEGIESAQLWNQPCPGGCQTGFENAALERFFADHGQYPLANRRGPVGNARWWPTI